MLDVRSLTKWYGGVDGRDRREFHAPVRRGPRLRRAQRIGQDLDRQHGDGARDADPRRGAVRRSSHRSATSSGTGVTSGACRKNPTCTPTSAAVNTSNSSPGCATWTDRIAARRIDALLDLFGLAAHADTSMSSYSKGMRQKVLIAAALLPDPPLLIFDEPLSGLDATSALVFRQLVVELAAAREGDALQLPRARRRSRRPARACWSCTRGVVVAHDEVGQLRERCCSRPSLEAVFRQLVCDVDPADTARDLVAAMSLGQ